MLHLRFTDYSENKLSKLKSGLNFDDEISDAIVDRNLKFSNPLQKPNIG